jgi:hypothetical protein
MQIDAGRDKDSHFRGKELLNVQPIGHLAGEIQPSNPRSPATSIVPSAPIAGWGWPIDAFKGLQDALKASGSL